jgi:hypothetical protein
MSQTIYITDNEGVTWQLGVSSGETTSSAAIGTGSQVVTPVSMTPGGFYIAPGASLLIDYGTARFEAVTVTAATLTTFTATFAVNHSVTPVTIITGGSLTVTPQNIVPTTITALPPIGGFPKIIWPDGGGNVLRFSWPNKDISYYIHKAERTDDYSTYGIHVSVTQRIDHFLEFKVPIILLGQNDAATWSTFLDYAATGGAFDYYPDSSITTWTVYHIDGTEVKMEYNAPGIYSIRGLRFRQVIT